ncbi:DUF2642 domain-containing protein [Metabacillus indicus]|uniref:DUF2642 domain-containing protein n=1 Tax=Metabacillus indicus TaxID=246786 RepID=UPI003174583B
MDFKKGLNEQIELKISGGIVQRGILIDYESDMFVIYDGSRFIYIPLYHIHSLNFEKNSGESVSDPENTPISDEMDSISFRKMLTHAKGLFTEITVLKNKSVYGYITNVLTDYIVFYSPVYKSMYISIQHIKSLIPYNNNETPYALAGGDLPLQHSSLPLARTFEEQLKKLAGKVVIFDLGEDEKKVGQLKSISQNIVTVITARREEVYCNPRHIKTIHLS